MPHNIRILNLDSSAEIEREMARIGSDHAGVRIMLPKAERFILRIENVRGKAASLLKQMMLSAGGEVCVSREVAAFDDTPRPVLMIGDARHLERMRQRLMTEPFGLREIAGEIEQVLARAQATPPPVQCGSRLLSFERTQVMGIINCTPDSFSGDGVLKVAVSDRSYTGSPSRTVPVGAVTDRDAVRADTGPGWVEAAIRQGAQFAADGADVLDVGGESTRPGSEGVSADEELRRVLPVIEGLVAQVDIPISIDSSKPEVCREALLAGATIINDITGLREPGMLELAAKTGAAVIIMHMQGEPRSMQHKPQYEDVMTEIYDFLAQGVEAAITAGIAETQIIIDPGFGFGKAVEHNLELVRRLREFHSLGRPVLLAASRKRTIGEITGKDAAERLMGTAAVHAIGIANGANMIRVHDVAPMVDVARMADAVAGLAGPA